MLCDLHFADNDGPVDDIAENGMKPLGESCVGATLIKCPIRLKLYLNVENLRASFDALEMQIRKMIAGAGRCAYEIRQL